MARHLLSLSLIVALLDAASAQVLPLADPAEETFAFALIGDMPYSPTDSVRFGRLVEKINRAEGLEWVVHVGDIKGGSSPCTDGLLQSRFEWFQQFERPFILVPGDNDWTDCHRSGYQPLDRLARVRALFFSRPGWTLGRHPMRVGTQGDTFPEHVRWTHGRTSFAVLHIVGSGNATAAFEGRTQANDAEVKSRTAAAIAWMRTTFAQAAEQDHRAIFLIIHANPRFEERENKPDGPYAAFLQALEQEVVRFGRPVALAHGDSHYFRVDKPLRQAGTSQRLVRFTRIEPFGTPEIHWLRVIVDPNDSHIFQVHAEIVAANLD